MRAIERYRVCMCACVCVCVCVSEQASEKTQDSVSRGFMEGDTHLIPRDVDYKTCDGGTRALNHTQSEDQPRKSHTHIGSAGEQRSTFNQSAALK